MGRGAVAACLLQLLRRRRSCAFGFGVPALSTIFAMLVIVLATLATLVVAGLVVAYVAFVHRGHDVPAVVPGADRLTALLRGVHDRWSIDPEPAEHRDPERRLHVRRGGLRRPSEN